MTPFEYFKKDLNISQFLGLLFFVSFGLGTSWVVTDNRFSSVIISSSWAPTTGTSGSKMIIFDKSAKMGNF